MRTFLILQMAVSSILLALIGLAVRIGGVQADERSPLPREGACTAPCWWGIRPGETGLEQANRLLIGQGYTPQITGPRSIYTPPKDTAGCIVSLQHQAGVVRQTRLSICPGLRLGDVLVALGQPDTMTTNFLTLNFASSAVRVQLHILDCGEHLSPFSPIQFMVLSEQNTAPGEPMALRWQGFALPWRYLRSKPDRVVLMC